MNLTSINSINEIKVTEDEHGVHELGAARVVPQGDSFTVFQTTCPDGVAEDDPDDSKFPVTPIGAYRTAPEAIAAAQGFVYGWLD